MLNRIDRVPLIIRRIYILACLSVSAIMIYFVPFKQAPLIGVAGIVYAYNQFVIILQTKGKVPSTIKYVSFAVDMTSLVLSSIFCFFSILNGYEPTLCKAFFASFILMLAGALFATFDAKKRNGLYDELSLYAPPLLSVCAYLIGDTIIALIITGGFILSTYFIATRIIFAKDEKDEELTPLVSEFILVATYRQVTKFCNEYDGDLTYEMKAMPANNFGFIQVIFKEHIPDAIKRKKIKAIQSDFNKKYPGFTLSIIHN